MAQNCNGQPSRACVSLWARPNSGGPGVNAWVPNCSGHCHNQGFESIIAGGKPIALGPLWTTVRCHVYNRSNCGGNKILDTGNVKGYRTFNTPGAQSVICYMGC